MIIRKLNVYYGQDSVNKMKLEEYVAIKPDGSKISPLEATEMGLKPDDIQTRYFGCFMAGAPVMDGSGDAIGIVPHEAKFPIDAENVQKAFEKFQSSFEIFMKEAMEEQNNPANQIIRPDAAMAEAIANKIILDS